MIQFYWYPKCTTCQRAKRWLDEHQVSYQALDLKETPPSAARLLALMKQFDYPVKRYFNTSGLKYRELQLKDQVPGFSPNEAAAILASDGMLIKRPLMFDEQRLTIGFNETDYEENWQNK